jgi:hypothetical protein
MTQEERYTRLAVNALRFARGSSSALGRLVWLDIADEYLGIAKTGQPCMPAAPDNVIWLCDRRNPKPPAGTAIWRRRR